MKVEEDFSLIGNGDCKSHYHLDDRTPTQDFLHGLHEASKVSTQTSSFTASLLVDYYLIDTTSGAVTVTMPVAKNNQQLTFIRTAGANSVTLNRAGTDMINGATSLTISTSYTPINLLAIGGLGYVSI